MNIIRQVRLSSIYATLSFTNEIASLLQLTKMLKIDRSSLDITVLEKRLCEAERKISLLFSEVGDIRAKLSLAKQLNRDTPNTVDAGEASTTLSYTKRAADEVCGTEIATKRSKHDFNVEDGYVIVYCDGACENNGRTNAKAGIGVWFGDENPLNISEPVKGRPTNNTAEIQACVAAAEAIKENGYKKVKFFTDSEFVINCMTKWIYNWKKNNWRTASGSSVKNKEDLVKLDQVLQSLEDVQWEHVKGHAGIKGNEEADRLARAGALRYKK